MFRESPEKTSGKKFFSLFFLVTLFPLITGNQEVEEPSGKGWVMVLLNGRMGCFSPTGLLSHCHPTLLCCTLMCTRRSSNIQIPGPGPPSEPLTRSVLGSRNPQLTPAPQMICSQESPVEKHPDLAEGGRFPNRGCREAVWGCGEGRHGDATPDTQGLRALWPHDDQAVLGGRAG